MGQKEGGNTIFAEKRAINNLYVKLKKVEWISVVKLDKSREAKIESCFDCPVEFLNPNGVSELNEILRFLKKIWTKYNNSNQRENIFHIFYPEKQN